MAATMAVAATASWAVAATAAVAAARAWRSLPSWHEGFFFSVVRHRFFFLFRPTSAVSGQRLLRAHLGSGIFPPSTEGRLPWPGVGCTSLACLRKPGGRRPDRAAATSAAGVGCASLARLRGDCRPLSADGCRPTGRAIRAADAPSLAQSIQRIAVP